MYFNEINVSFSFMFPCKSDCECESLCVRKSRVRFCLDDQSSASELISLQVSQHPIIKDISVIFPNDHLIKFLSQ